MSVALDKSTTSLRREEEETTTTPSLPNDNTATTTTTTSINSNDDNDNTAAAAAVAAGMKLSPEVVERLQQLQDANRPVSIDEILQAANLSHLAVNQPKPSKSADNRLSPESASAANDVVIPTKSASMTLAERRRIPASTEKLRLYAQMAHPDPSSQQTEEPFVVSTAAAPEATVAAANTELPHQQQTSNNTESLLDRYEQENDELPPEDADLDLLTHLERQQSLLAADPKSSCIDASVLLDQLNNNDNDNDNRTTTTTTSKDDDGFWKHVAQNYTTAAPRFARLLISRLRRQGIAAPWRGVVWQAMAQSSDTHLASMYDKLVQGDMGMSSYERVIDRDVARMTDHHREATGRMLKAYSVYDAHVGYCQGLAMLARPLLMEMNERHAFCSFVRLMEAHEMRALFMLNMEGLHLRLHQFQTLLSQQCPRLFQHLSSNTIHAPMYASQWFLTLFASSLPTAVALRMYDLVFAQGAVPTMMRVAIAVMQKHQDRLLNICQFEQLMTYLTSGTLHEDPEELVAAVLDLTSTITVAKLDSIAEAYHIEAQQEKDRAQQLLAIRFNGMTTRRANKRESWFSWGNSAATPAHNNNSHLNDSVSPPTSPLSPTASSGKVSLDHRRNVSTLHQQIEDLVTAMSHLQKEHSQLNENVTAMKMRELDYESERSKLSKRNATLEKRLKKYKTKLANASPSSNSNNNNNGLPPPAAASPQQSQLERLEKDTEFKSFVDSLRMSGDFGALIAGALSTDAADHSSDKKSASSNKSSKRSVSKRSSVTSSYRNSQSSMSSSSSNNSNSQNDSENDTVATAVEDLSVSMPTNDSKKGDNSNKSSEGEEALHQVTSELVAVKLASFEMGQKYEQLCHKYNQVEKQLATSQHEQKELSQQVSELQATMDAMQTEKEQILQEHEDLAKENEELMDKNMAAKRTSAELQFEKMAMTKEMEKLEKRLQTLEKEKQEYFMPRGTFTEEVFAAHRILFDNHKKEKELQQQQQASSLTRRHTLQLTTTTTTTTTTANNEEFQSKYVESDLRCRELEKLLAEAKVKLAEYEASTMPLSPRASLQRSSVHMKRTSTASLSMLASRVTSPTSITDPNRRDSAESYASSVTSATSLGSAPNSAGMTTTSNNNYKRSSMYARLWNSLGPAAPAGVTANNGGARNSVVVKQQI
ncbi:rab-GTPase-TBC domain-containing protein [Zychaea mexicana]|uniref:rab-GTPase-TBC domain-containing protein n=1 Tax=Zychaea mexicana TaxID=64656 RepID=UPI0022FE1B22|nr:rab-GTPase-TBC domain-containing protein [Zychaea mexicana]KAI9488737.1 rab-GTPase-TBC domain-containing protein [Zychaea mexicana]